MKTKSKKDIIKVIKEYKLAIDQTYRKDHEHFLLICDFLEINSMCFREVREVRFIEDTMWIDDKVSIDVKDVKEVDIHFTSIRYDKVKIVVKEKDGFTLQ